MNNHLQWKYSVEPLAPLINADCIFSLLMEMLSYWLLFLDLSSVLFQQLTFILCVCRGGEYPWQWEVYPSPDCNELHKKKLILVYMRLILVL